MGAKGTKLGSCDKHENNDRRDGAFFFRAAYVTD